MNDIENTVIAEYNGSTFVKKGILTALVYFLIYTVVVYISDYFMHLGGLVSEIFMQGSMVFYAVMALCMYPVERRLIKPATGEEKLVFFSSFLMSSLPFAFLNMLIGAAVIDPLFYLDEWRYGATAGLNFGIYGIGLAVLFAAAVVARSVISFIRNFGK